MVDLLAVEIALHQLVGVLGDLVHQFLAVFLGLGPELLGDLGLGGVVAAGSLADECPHVDQVDDAADVVFGPDRDLGRDDVGAEGALQRVEGGEEVGALAIEHVDEDEPSEALVVGAAPEPLGVDLDPHRGVDHDDRRIGDPQRGDGVGDEARLAGGVDQVDLAAFVLEGRDRGVNRHLALLLVGLVIGDRGAVGDRSEPVRRTGLEQHRLVQARLAAAPVPDQGDIANPVCGLMRHAWEPTPAAEPTSTALPPWCAAARPATRSPRAPHRSRAGSGPRSSRGRRPAAHARAVRRPPRSGGP